MKVKRLTAVIISVVIVLAITAFSFAPTVGALGEQRGSITLHITSSATGEPLDGTVFRLYFIARAEFVGEDVRYEFVKPYDKANISLDNLQDSYLPVHLAGFAVTGNLPCVEKTAGKDGVIVYDNLEPGLYLLLPYGNFDGYYTPVPFIINIPEFDSGKQIWEYDIVATPKMLRIDGDADTLTTYVSVRKEWETQGEHPDSVTVVLLRDLEEYARVELNESNNWQHRWNSLPKNHIWNAVEIQVPDGYEVSYETSSNTVTIINKADSSTEETTTDAVDFTQEITTPDSTTSSEVTTQPSQGGLVTGTTVPDKPGVENTTGNHNLTEQETTTEKETLVDTGQLNWPVPVLAVSGLLVFSLGWVMLNCGKKETE